MAGKSGGCWKEMRESWRILGESGKLAVTSYILYVHCMLELYMDGLMHGFKGFVNDK